MKRDEFWIQAFLASLSRVSPDQAKADADRATAICIFEGRLDRVEKRRPELKSKWLLARNAFHKLVARPH